MGLNRKVSWLNDSGHVRTTQFGEKADAIADYAQLLRMPYRSRIGSPRLIFVTTVHVIRHDRHYSPLRGDPRFEALLDDPKNNALF